MVHDEVLRGPDSALDKPAFIKWFAARGNRIQTVETTYGAMWRALTEEARAKIKRSHSNAGELSIREFTDRIKDILRPGDQALVLFEDDAVKKIDFGPHVHLLHSYAFMVSLERLSVITSAEELYREALRRGRQLARDLFERRAVTTDRSVADWRQGYEVQDDGG
jgi:hypothetical protein